MAAAKGYVAANNAPKLTKHKNHMAKVLKEDPELYSRMAALKTPNGYTFDYCIQTGVDNRNPFENVTSVGATAGDGESFQVWKQFFDGLIGSYHSDYPAEFKHITDWDETKLDHEGFPGDYVSACRVSTSRCVEGLSTPAFCTRAERREVQEVIKRSCETLEGDSAGIYQTLKEIETERQQEICEKQLDFYLDEGGMKLNMFEKPTSNLRISANMTRDWPDARGLFVSTNEKITICVNQDEHLRITTKENTNLKDAFILLYSTLGSIENTMSKNGHLFIKSEHLGYLNTCPSNVGTALRAVVTVNLEKLSKHDLFQEILENCHLLTRETSKDGWFDVWNADVLGISETEILTSFCNSMDTLIDLEKKLEQRTDISDFAPSPIIASWKEEN